METHAVRDDAALWREAGTDPTAFGELYERHARAVYAFCARQTGDLSLAEDLTSVVFLEAWRRRRSIELNGTSALPWLLGTAKNVARNSQRSLRRYRAALGRLPPGGSTASAEDDAIPRVDAQRRLTVALEAIAGLSRDQRDVVNLVLWSGVSYEDAARVLDVPVGTVRSRVARARQKLGESLAAPVTSSSKESS
jgi:RNA polymerase sigma factor (sigma-70 family)